MTDLIPLLIQAIIDLLYGIWGFEIQFTLGQVVTFLIILWVIFKVLVALAKQFISLAGSFVLTLVKSALGGGLEAYRERKGDAGK